MNHSRKLCVLLIGAMLTACEAEDTRPCMLMIDRVICQNYIDLEGYNDTSFYVGIYIVENPQEQALFRVDVEDFVELTLMEGHLTSIPEDVYNMDRLEALKILRNEITNVNFYKFMTMPNLKIIDLADNQIAFIESGDNMKSNYNSSVKSIDLSYNSIEVVPNNFVKPFHNLKYLYLSHNKISSIGLLAFEGIIHLETLDISNNMLVEVGNVFPKLPKLRELSLSNNKLPILLESNFVELSDLEKLDVSSNEIEHISLLTFEGLVQLKLLDISNNTLNKVGYAFAPLSNLRGLSIAHNNIIKLLDYNFVTLTKLIKLYASYNDIQTIETCAFETLTKLEVLDLGQNKIEVISKAMFASNTNLTWLSLLNNRIEGIEPHTFTGKNIDKFYIQNNQLKGPIATGTFCGIHDPELNLSVGNITSVGDEAFADMNHLKYLNLSTNDINNISYLAFSSLVSLDVLDISHNKLQTLNFESDSLRNLLKLYAHHNNIENIITNVFENFVSLQELDLSYNEIKAIEPHQFLNKLTYLDLSYNTDMKIIDDPFKGITQLNRLSLQHVRTGITFENSSTSVRVLEMQSCGIIDINIVYIYNVEKVVSLNLSMNKIAVIDRNTFKSMPSLVNLDLSLNEITFIQPGSFLQTTALNNINFYGNGLKSIQYGVFDGLDVLTDLNLAKNVLIRYDVKLKPIIAKLSLDDNCLTNFNFKELFNTKTSKLSIGGNQIPCDVFAEIKYSNYSEKFKNIVTANTLNYYTENINGISCQNGPSDTSVVVPMTQTPGTNMSPLISLLEHSLQKISLSLQAISENTHKTETSLKDLIESSNDFLVANNEKLTNITNQLELIKKIINDDISNGKDLVVLPVTDAPNVLSSSDVSILLLKDTS